MAPFAYVVCSQVKINMGRNATFLQQDFGVRIRAQHTEHVVLYICLSNFWPDRLSFLTRRSCCRCLMIWTAYVCQGCGITIPFLHFVQSIRFFDVLQYHHKPGWNQPHAVTQFLPHQHNPVLPDLRDLLELGVGLNWHLGKFCVTASAVDEQQLVHIRILFIFKSDVAHLYGTTTNHDESNTYTGNEVSRTRSYNIRKHNISNGNKDLYLYDQDDG